MKLTELEPQFLRYVMTPNVPMQIANDPMNFPDGGTHVEFRDQVSYHPVDTLEEAQGIKFLCPKCFEANGNSSVGTHGVVCWSRSRGVPDDAKPGPGRWKLDGNGYEDLTLNADPPNELRSVQLTSGCMWHGGITNGEVTPA